MAVRQFRPSVEGVASLRPLLRQLQAGWYLGMDRMASEVSRRSLGSNSYVVTDESNIRFHGEFHGRHLGMGRKRILGAVELQPNTRLTIRPARQETSRTARSSGTMPFAPVASPSDYSQAPDDLQLADWPIC